MVVTCCSFGLWCSIFACCWCSWSQTKCRYKGLCLCRPYWMSSMRHKKSSTVLSLTRLYCLFFFFSFNDAFMTWSCSCINSRAFCQLCYEQHFCLRQWNRLGAGWPWIARLTGKGYFLASGGVILAYKMWLKRVKPTLQRLSRFLRGREQEGRIKHTCYY